ncbi:hypothetical protein SRHO_G00138490 [Serrasalmus rhombeus]
MARAHFLARIKCALAPCGAGHGELRQLLIRSRCVTPHFGQQGMGGYCPQGQPYFSQSQQQQQQQQQQPVTPTQPPYIQPRTAPQQEAQENYGNRSHPAGNSGKSNHDEIGLIQQDRPSSLPPCAQAEDELACPLCPEGRSSPLGHWWSTGQAGLLPVGC